SLSLAGDVTDSVASEFFVSFHFLLLSPRRYCFFFTDTASTDIYTLSLHDALPIYTLHKGCPCSDQDTSNHRKHTTSRIRYLSSLDRKSTRLNSSHVKISYAVFCLKKKKWTTNSLSLKAKYYFFESL